MSIKKTFLASFSAAMLLLGVNDAAQAAISANFSTVSQGSSVTGGNCGPYGACWMVGAPFVTSGDLNTAMNSLESEIKADGQSFNTGQMQQLAAEKKLDNQTLQELVRQAENRAIARMAQHQNTVTSPTLSASQPMLSGCQQSPLYNSLSGQSAATAAIANQYAGIATTVDQGTNSGIKTRNALANANPMTLTANSILPSAQTPASAYPTTAEMAETIAHLTNPLPPVKITQGQSWTPAGAHWKALRHAQAAKLTAAQSALAEIAAEHTPSLSATPFIALYDQAQAATGNSVSGTGKNSPANPPGVAMMNGQPMISPDGALNLMMLSRYGNPQWYEHLAQENPAGVAKENSEMGVLALRVDWESLRSMEHTTQILAARLSQTAVQPETNHLNAMAGNAMAESNGSLQGQGQ